ncbi:hypothetical protein RM780_04150 [Streptomyces sp. DSM 44917]|uniref:Uncharacterized protein n=1 Tax=Streptomyces boetiae TaxID=3075541 RepID=A0ABU2L3M8_9ACTN|nr:hypothetical protein [Streptomyces sp. DSM 44917]MDT0306154.1 hypothetical protein [Streptomyces sp. DSM 44917]
MSTYAYLAIRCDVAGCYAETHTSHHVDTYTELRRLRSADGWRTRRHPRGGPLLDLCPDHAREETRRA